MRCTMVRKIIGWSFSPSPLSPWGKSDTRKRNVKSTVHEVDSEALIDQNKPVACILLVIG